MKPILIDLPIPIETDRLIIRPAMPGDGRVVNEAVLESFDALKLWVPWAKVKPSIDDSEEECRRAAARWVLREDLRFHLFDKLTQRFIGGTGLHRINWNVPKFEIGYWCRSSEEGRGFITESAAALTRYCFQQLAAKRVEIRIDVKNERSRNVPSRLGFALEGIAKQDSIAPDDQSLRDTAVYVKFDERGLPDLHAKWST
jgi:RimJ/RimL family protein N-acetyltransferase